MTGAGYDSNPLKESVAMRYVYRAIAPEAEEKTLGFGGYVFETRTLFTFFFAPCDCHPDRSARGIWAFEGLSGAEWRDPEDASFVITASRRSHQTASGNKLMLSKVL